VIAQVLPGSVSGELLERGDVILDVNRAPVARASEAVDKIRATPPNQPVLLRIRREGRTLFVAVERR
jgi:S1-C subfamily serine protease